MPRFSEHLGLLTPRLHELARLASPLRPLEAILETAQAGRGLGTEDVASLMVWGREPDCQAAIHAAAQATREAWGGRAIEFIIPEYLTSFCQNDCLYCGYRKSNPLAERLRLSRDEYERELDLILAWGYRQIELVLADDPDFGAERLASYVSLTREKLAEVGGGVVALNAPPYDEGGYRRLRSVGLDWVALWQETYEAGPFGRWHFQGSPKRQFEFRLDVWDRAIPAGLTRVALGILFGLYDWRFEVLALVEHAAYLRKTYGVEPHALGIPRLKPARGVLASQKPSRFTVRDEDYRLAVSIYHLAFPRTRLFFNTRETYEFNMSMLARGDLFTVDCETLPGAYLRGRLPGQFATHCYPKRRDVATELAARGYACHYLAPEDHARVAMLQPGSGKVFTPEQIRRSAREHWEIRTRLDEWETFLDRLRTTSAHLRWIAAGEFRERLRFFETTYIEHCRQEENILQASLAEKPEWEERVASFRLDHERLAIDLDRLQRQATSYEQSGDPTVLLMLGNRVITALRAHLDAEDRYFSHWLEAEPSGRSAAH